MGFLLLASKSSAAIGARFELGGLLILLVSKLKRLWLFDGFLR
jgi:hypothetical protein